MSSLKELQDRFQAGILSGDDAALDAALADIKDSDREDRSVLFGVYRNAYVLRLLEILGKDYELTHAYVGDATFAKLARGYVAAHPSDQRNARWFGRHLPDFARDTAPFSDHPEVGELAALEKALADAFDGPNADPLTVEDLASVAPEDWQNLVFSLHPTATQLKFNSNAADIWLAMKDETTPPEAVRLPEQQTVLVWRQEFMSRFRPLEAEEAMMWNEATGGTRFGVLCEMVATFAGPDDAELRAATYLKAWVDAGLLVSAGTQPSDVESGAGNKALERPVNQ